MTRDEIGKMRETSPAKFNGEVAELVFGWERWTCRDYDGKAAVLFASGKHLTSWWKVGREIPLEPNGAVMAPRFASNPTADYSVLKLVRETWESRQRSTWSIFLAYIHHYRARAKPIIPNALGVLYYEPGDYAAAALLCVDADAEGGKS